MVKKKLIGRSRSAARRQVRCYLCGHRLDVSAKTLSTTCPKCHKAIKVEDVVVKNYLPVNDVLTCGLITVTKRGRIAAKRVQSGDGVVCEGAIEGKVETPGPVQLGAKASWKGDALISGTLAVTEGATLNGRVTVPCAPEDVTTAQDRRPELVRVVDPPDPTASLVDDDDDLSAPPPPKSAQITEPKPQQWSPMQSKADADSGDDATLEGASGRQDSASQASKVSRSTSDSAAPRRKTRREKPSTGTSASDGDAIDDADRADCSAAAAPTARKKKKRTTTSTSTAGVSEASKPATTRKSAGKKTTKKTTKKTAKKTVAKKKTVKKKTTRKTASRGSTSRRKSTRRTDSD